MYCIRIASEFLKNRKSSGHHFIPSKSFMSCLKLIAFIKWKASATNATTTAIAFILKINKQNDKTKCWRNVCVCVRVWAHCDYVIFALYILQIVLSVAFVALALDANTCVYVISFSVHIKMNECKCFYGTENHREMDFFSPMQIDVYWKTVFRLARCLCGRVQINWFC